MTFNDVVEKIMPEVESGSNEPFIIYRDNKGEWQSDFTQNQYGETFDWVEDVKLTDPLAATYTGKDLAHASFPAVYDKVMMERLHGEYAALTLEEITLKLEGTINFLDENIGYLSNEATDYLINMDKPLAAANAMIPFSLESHCPENSYYNEAKAQEAINAIEAAVSERMGLSKPKKKPTIQEKLDKAKEKAAKHDTAKKEGFGDKPKKRDERE